MKSNSYQILFAITQKYAMHWLVVKRLYTWGQEREVQNKFISIPPIWKNLITEINFQEMPKNSGRNPKTNEEEIQEREGEGAQQIHFHISGVGKI